MGEGRRTFVVLPVLDEADVLARVIEDVRAALAPRETEVIVVDDGSRDGSADVARGVGGDGLVVLVHERNRGLGAALATGLGHALDRAAPDDVVVTSESDGTQPAAVLGALVGAVEEGADVAVATPLARGLGGGFAGVPLHRRLLSRGANLVYATLLPVRGLDDYTNLQRAFRAQTLLAAERRWGRGRLFDRPGFEAVPDLLLQLRTERPRVAQVGVVIDASRQRRPSSMRLARTALASLALCLRHRLGRVRPG